MVKEWESKAKAAKNILFFGVGQKLADGCEIAMFPRYHEVGRHTRKQSDRWFTSGELEKLAIPFRGPPQSGAIEFSHRAAFAILLLPFKKEKEQARHHRAKLCC